MELFSGFAWPVPRAFASAVSAGRFEQGDVFYDAASAYGEWALDAAPGHRFRVQVLDPPRSSRVLADADGSRFGANWASPVTVEVGDYASKTRTQLQSTQSRLFCCLWRGDRELLRETEPGEAPLPMPATARDLQKHLDAAAAALQVAVGRKTGAGSLFAFVVDEASEASLAKTRSIEAALAGRYEVEPVDRSPVDAGVPDGGDYHPALRLRGLWVAESREEPVRELLKTALYGPSGEGPDRFKLERHGILLSGDASQDG